MHVFVCVYVRVRACVSIAGRQGAHHPISTLDTLADKTPPDQAR